MADPVPTFPHDTPFLIATCDDGSVELALSDVRAAAPQARRLAELAPGVLLIDAGQPVAAMVATWRMRPPVFVRHLFPVQATAALQSEPEDLRLLARMAGAERDGVFAPAVDPILTLSVQTRVLADLPYKPFDVNSALAAALGEASGVTIDVRAPAQVLSVVCARRPAGGSARLGELPLRSATRAQREPGWVAWLGLSLAGDNLSNWAGGMRRFAREEGQVSRAEFKLLEAIEVFGLTLTPRGVALDLGAAPGGWTRVLRQHGLYVTAVDPGELDERLQGDAAIRHKHMTAEEYLRQDPDHFDVIVNDMRMDARDSARLMTAYAPLLYAHGFALMTLKLPEQRREPLLEQAFRILGEAYRIAGARQLFHNRSEITVLLRPKV